MPHALRCALIGISIHALLAESDLLRHSADCSYRSISIHALLAESDRKGFAMRWNTCISIHALLAESDGKIPANIMSHSDFYPRSPCGERPISIVLSIQPTKFLSTLSLRRATEQSASYNAHLEISIHALLAESDGKGSRRRVLSGISIHALLAESDISDAPSSAPYAISIHALLAESDISVLWMVLNRLLFLSTLSLRRATVSH